MTLDQAIEHAQEAGTKMINREDCKSCGEEHLQLASWLEELKQYRIKYGKLPTRNKEEIDKEILKK